MKTDDLITLLAQDNRRPVNLSMALSVAIIAGALVAALIFFSMLGFRHDIAQAAETIRFDFKFLVTLALFATATSLVAATIRPGSKLVIRRRLLLIAPILLAAAAAVEMAVTPPDQWLGKLIGHNALHCLTIIPALSLFPAFFLFLAIRNGAPENPGVTGAIAALASAGIAATLYASNCFDDSPLFVATWYPIAAGIVATAGYFAGKRFLRW
ncbi:NrsF family protein [Rhizobium sp. A37_96]